MEIELIICYVDRTWTTKSYVVSFDDDERGKTVSLEDRAEELFWTEYNNTPESPLVAHVGLYNTRND